MGSKNSILPQVHNRHATAISHAISSTNISFLSRIAYKLVFAGIPIIEVMIINKLFMFNLKDVDYQLGPDGVLFAVSRAQIYPLHYELHHKILLSSNLLHVSHKFA